MAQVVEAAKDPSMVLGDFNANLGKLDDAQRRGPTSGEGGKAEQRQIVILATVASLGLRDTARAFRQPSRTGTWTWEMDRKERRVRLTVYYVLMEGDQLVHHHRVRCVAYISTDHRMVYVDLTPGDQRIQQQYVK
jgi:hypothetical protein